MEVLAGSDLNVAENFKFVSQMEEGYGIVKLWINFMHDAITY